MECGKLYIVSTPIGNLEDITFRAVNLLKNVDIVLAEDTRIAHKIFSKYSINTNLVSYHKFSGEKKKEHILNLILSGKEVALISDSGTPLINDPGDKLVASAIDAGIGVFPIPGPSAFLSALVVSGADLRSFVYEGFIPRSPSKRRKFFSALNSELRTVVFYESPHRLLKSLSDMLAVMGDRDIAVIRELTKKFEEHFYGKVSESIEYYGKKGVKGEFVIVLKGVKG